MDSSLSKKAVFPLSIKKLFDRGKENDPKGVFMNSLCNSLDDITALFRESELTNPFEKESHSRIEKFTEISRHIQNLRGDLQKSHSLPERITLLQRFCEKTAPIAGSINDIFHQTLLDPIVKELESAITAHKKQESQAPQAPQAENRGTHKRPAGSDFEKGPEAKKTHPPSSSRDIPSLEKLTISAGIRNKGNMCFALSAFKSLWASQRIRNLLQTVEKEQSPPPPLVPMLLKLLKLLDIERPDRPIDHTNPVLVELFETMAKTYPFLREEKQQDATEFLQAIFSEILPKNMMLFSFQETSIRPKDLDLQAFIPSIDSTHDTKENVCILSVPANSKEPLDLERELNSPVREEKLDPEEVLHYEGNQGEDPKKLSEYLDAFTKKTKGKTFSVRKDREFYGSIPTVLPINVWRPLEEAPSDIQKMREQLASFMSAKEIKALSDEQVKQISGAQHNVHKSKIPVHPPRILSIRHKDAGELRYALRSIVIHTGLAEGGGHYYTYIIPPHNASSEEKKFVFKHDDEKVTKIPLNDDVQRDIAENGYSYIYDLLD